MEETHREGHIAPIVPRKIMFLPRPVLEINGRQFPLIAGSSKGDTFENDLIKLIFGGDTIANLAVNATSSPLTALAFSLHTSDPGEAGGQNTNETAYTGYARVTVSRTTAAGGFTITNNSVSPISNIDFGECTASPGSNITHFAVGTATTGAGKLLYSGTVAPTIAMAIGVIPRLKTTSAISED